MRILLHVVGVMVAGAAAVIGADATPSDVAALPPIDIVMTVTGRIVIAVADATGTRHTLGVPFSPSSQPCSALRPLAGGAQPPAVSVPAASPVAADTAGSSRVDALALVAGRTDGVAARIIDRVLSDVRDRINDMRSVKMRAEADCDFAAERRYAARIAEANTGPVDAATPAQLRLVQAIHHDLLLKHTRLVVIDADLDGATAPLLAEQVALPQRLEALRQTPKK